MKLPVREEFEVSGKVYSLRLTRPHGKLVLAEAHQLTGEDCGPHLADQGLVVGDVVERQEDRAEHFAGNKKVPEIRTGVAAAGQAAAVGIEGSEVLLVCGIFDADGTMAGEGHSIAAIASRHNAVEHVDAAADGFEQIFGATDTHQIARLVRGQERDSAVEGGIHLRRRLSDTQATDGVAGEVHAKQPKGRAFAEIRMKSTLHDPKERLVGAGLGGSAAFGPASGAVDGAKNFFAGFAGRRAFVEAHDAVCSERFLDLHGAFRRKLKQITVDVGSEDDFVVIEPAKIGKTEHLKSAAVGENRAIPIHELVQPAMELHDAFAGAEGKMVGVGQQHLCTNFTELLWEQTLD